MALAFSSCRGHLKSIVSDARVPLKTSMMPPRSRTYTTSTTARTSLGAASSASKQTHKISLIVASSRIPGNGAGIAAWLKSVLQDDLAPISHTLDVFHPNTPPLPLGPLVDGTYLPSSIKDPALYPSAAVREWSTLVSSTDLFVFLTPEYNGGFPGELKNTLDHIYWEWRNKPAVIVSYGGSGGPRASAMLRGLLQNFRVRVVEKSVQISLPKEYSGGSQRVPVSGPFPDFLEAYIKKVHEAVDEAKKLVV